MGILYGYFAFDVVIVASGQQQKEVLWHSWFHWHTHTLRSTWLMDMDVDRKGVASHII